MMIIVGLGNPGSEYENTRHNTGRMILEMFRRKNDFSDWEENKKLKSLVSKKSKITLLLPETSMNKSGEAVSKLIKSKKSAENLVVIHDDLDLSLGRFKISFNRGAGGHRGISSIVKALKTEAFTRIRVGIAPVTPGGKTKKPLGEKAVIDFILGEFKTKELEILKKTTKKIIEASETIISEGKEKAMGKFN
ncbi:MAG: aminoacyl-tRNA hydrolase [Candidatus Taylorbacteria bacterium RIFCSPHIGHO2_02_FULL_44_36]|uniref:Peptidyl-tRNA hydrolase n=1 Tax=Candidatus Taylorbacteria bacterium RIFCSPLOWO2_12_FULL_44_15c TaxID=1802333 RepID=A0A1G2P5Q5_9BACT|nr:MAG: aminoacyl-tRNA hydrolase [Candidatus Taylorbacteria bacterium RIFCSPHIGHO2_02_FULL_44_36]OHA39637.1 MAG: aminoacyl-tRNA hydrolase [Candidatus Taylorbacteria bacterium RIFCSPLOWO2_02_FULL_44_35]OHA42962.1 MAG: aminoacyl-tRNA hydrolase [Candidatus Taylorbacteria bacterium RIFCSPLOWO2_12_FULL_44_15c]